MKDIEAIEIFTGYKTSDGKVFEDPTLAKLHAPELRWLAFCDELCVTRSDAELIWENRLASINILDIVVEPEQGLGSCPRCGAGLFSEVEGRPRCRACGLGPKR